MFRIFLRYFRDFCGIFTFLMETLNYRILDICFHIPNMEPRPFQMQESPIQDHENRGNSTEITQKYHFRIRKSSAKFYIKIRKPHFKLRKALFKRGLERNGKNRNVLEIDVEKDGGIIFWKRIFF